jgi:hypothetical protein
MKPILGKTSRRERAKALGRGAMVILTLLSGLGVARADTTGFTNDFAAAFWSSEVQFGTTYFTNGNTELVVAGPTTPPPGGTSYDGILYNGPLSGGLAVGGTVQFHWAYNAGDATAEAAIAWTPPDSGSPVQYQFNADTDPGVIVSGVFSTNLLAGTTFEFLLTTTPAGPDKPSATLTISGFQFLDVPEPSTGAFLAGMLTCLGAVRWRRSRRPASSRR